jgi:hypothetical protein
LNLKLLEVPWSPQGKSEKVETMSLAIKLLGVTALCVLCCALPAILVATVGLFQIFGLTWGVVGVIGSLTGIAALSMFASRLRAKGTSNSCSCSSTCENDPVPELRAPPIACTLSSDDYQERVKSIRKLAQRSLRSSRRTPLTLHLVYDRTAVEEVEKVVRDEQRCCAFLRFDMAQKDDGVHLLIAAPIEAAQAADTLFGHFAPELAHQKN